MAKRRPKPVPPRQPAPAPKPPRPPKPPRDIEEIADDLMRNFSLPS
jgi:hypothetical protein